MNDAFDRLKMDFPIFEIRNTKSYPAQIELIGDSVQINGYATGKVNSNQLYQIPDLSIFKMISPSMEDFINYGVIGGKDSTGSVQESETLATPSPTTEELADPVPSDEVKRPDATQPENKPAPSINSAPSNRATSTANNRR